MNDCADEGFITPSSQTRMNSVLTAAFTHKKIRQYVLSINTMAYIHWPSHSEVSRYLASYPYTQRNDVILLKNLYLS